MRPPIVRNVFGIKTQARSPGALDKPTTIVRGLIAVRLIFEPILRPSLRRISAVTVSRISIRLVMRILDLYEGIFIE